MPFTYTELFDIAIKGILEQQELGQESSEVGDFWNTLQGYQTLGKCIDNVHYHIRYLRSFRPLSMKDYIVFKDPRPIIYLNTAAVSSLFGSRTLNVTANRSNWSTIVSYLKSHTSYLGLKQERFTILLPNGQPDFMFETVNGQQVKRIKVNRPKASCFDYLQLKDAFNLELEMEVVSEKSEMSMNDKANVGNEANNSEQGELPF